MTDLEAAREYYRQRETQRRAQREAERQQWLRRTHEAIWRLALDYPGVRRVVLFHNLYNAFENTFQNIAAVFENSVDEVERWHAQLLERMRLDVMPLRPAVIDDTAYDALDELRRFRHLFRHAYSVNSTRYGCNW